MARRISSSEAAAGRYSSMILISASSFWASSSRPPFRNCSIESLRCFTRVPKIDRTSPSSSAFIFSISLFFTADFIMRSVFRRSESLPRMASVMCAWIFSCNVIVFTILALNYPDRSETRHSRRKAGIMDDVHHSLNVLVGFRLLLRKALASQRLNHDTARLQLLLNFLCRGTLLCRRPAQHPACLMTGRTEGLAHWTLLAQRKV